MDINQTDAFVTGQTIKQGGISTGQASVIAKLWKNHKRKIRESAVGQSRWENNVKSMNWRIDLKSQSDALISKTAPLP
ncbi:hypothetical protein XELAEV_18028480mg [Xenopus laevis]|uniref:COMMD1 N-terminal domain-containing protein n=1 Tax=Xenopus laevis TaxID=8355 RepID=A0A974CR27_XENLA|nr:hypothetical protein XELAEV_18028480mg [Xenopus laevis]